MHRCGLVVTTVGLALSACGSDPKTSVASVPTDVPTCVSLVGQTVAPEPGPCRVGHVERSMASFGCIDGSRLYASGDDPEAIWGRTGGAWAAGPPPEPERTTCLAATAPPEAPTTTGPAPAPAGASAPATRPVPTTTPSKAGPRKEFGDGTWAVGRDVAAGRYETTDAWQSCTFEARPARPNVPGGNYPIIWVNDQAHRYVDIADGQELRISGCGTWRPHVTPPLPTSLAASGQVGGQPIFGLAGTRWKIADVGRLGQFATSCTLVGQKPLDSFAYWAASGNAYYGTAPKEIPPAAKKTVAPDGSTTWEWSEGASGFYAFRVGPVPAHWVRAPYSGIWFWPTGSTGTVTVPADAPYVAEHNVTLGPCSYTRIAP